MSEGSPTEAEATLRRAMSGMAALSSLPALWVNADERRIAEILAEAALRVLDLAGVHIVLPSEIGEAVEVECLTTGTPSELAPLLRAAFAECAQDASARAVSADGRLRGVCVWLGTTGEARLYAIASRCDFPTEAERLSLSMAANQATVALQRARVEAALRAETAALNRERDAVAALNRTIGNERNKLRSLFEQAPGFMALLTGPQHVFELWNASYVRLVGEREFSGRSVREVFPDLEGQGFFEQLDAVYASGEPYVTDRAVLDLRRTPGGVPERRYIDFIYQPIFDEPGRVTGIFAEGHDVTEQTRAAEHRQLLINELNHRVKNTLATVQSMAHQTLRRATTVQDGHDRLTARLMALSNAHNVLTRENWERASLTDIVREAMRPHDDPQRPRVAIQGHAVHLAPSTALALSMALHELATNAAKYGALSTDQGRVTIKWVGDGPNHVLLEWRERGGPPVVPPTGGGFGSRLLTQGLSVELGSGALIAYEPKGVTCRMRAPVGQTVDVSEQSGRRRPKRRSRDARRVAFALEGLPSGA